MSATAEHPHGSERGRRHIFSGAVELTGHVDAAARLARIARDALAHAFGCAERARTLGALDEDAHFARLSEARAAFREDPRAMRALRELVEALGFDPARCVVDWPRLRVVLPGGHLNPKAHAAFTAHRDTWFANPRQQINLWTPLWDAPREVAFGFYPEAFGASIPNTSATFDYARFTADIGFQGASAPAAARFPTTTGALGGARVVRHAVARGSVLIFSAAHLHRTMGHDEELGRASVDCRVVCLDDVEAGVGAPDADNESTGDAMIDYVAWPMEPF